MIKLYRCDIHEGERDSEASLRLICKAAKELCGVDAPVVLRTEKGKPYFKDLPLKFSVSHSDGKVVVAVSDKEIGVDIQHVKPRSPAVAKRFFTFEECTYVGDDIARFYEIWTKKEAYGKWEGSGLAAALKVDVMALQFYTENDGDYVIAVYE